MSFKRLELNQTLTGVFCGPLAKDLSLPLLNDLLAPKVNKNNNHTYKPSETVELADMK